VPRVWGWIVLFSLGFLDCVRGFFEWALQVIGFWKLLFGACFVHFLYVVKLAAARALDAFWNTNIFTSWVFAGVESWGWRLVSSHLPCILPAPLAPSWAYHMLYGPDVITTMPQPPDIVAVPASRLEFIDDLASPRVAMMVVVLMRVVVAFRRG
jgi:hypothetical protein